MNSQYNYSEGEKEELSIEENLNEFSLDEDEINNKNNKKNTRLLTIKSKLKVFSYSKKYNKTEAAKHFDIPSTTINDLVKNISKFLALP